MSLLNLPSLLETDDKPTEKLDIGILPTVQEDIEQKPENKILYFIHCIKKPLVLTVTSG